MRLSGGPLEDSLWGGPPPKNPQQRAQNMHSAGLGRGRVRLERWFITLSAGSAPPPGPHRSAHWARVAGFQGGAEPPLESLPSGVPPPGNPMCTLGARGGRPSGGEEPPWRGASSLSRSQGGRNPMASDETNTFRRVLRHPGAHASGSLLHLKSAGLRPCLGRPERGGLGGRSPPGGFSREGPPQGAPKARFWGLGGQSPLESDATPF